MQKAELEKLKLDLSVQAKNGLDFIIAATIIWFVIAYAIMAGVISLGAMLIGMSVPADKMYFIPLFMSLSLIVLSFLIVAAYKKNRKRLYPAEEKS